MLKFTTAIVAATVLCMHPASAAKLGGALSATDSTSQTTGDKENSIVSFVYAQLKGSVSLITSAAKVSAGDADAADGKNNDSYTKRDCDAGAESDENKEILEAENQALAGPEPLYFGF